MLKILSLIVALLFTSPLLFSDMVEVKLDPSYYGVYTEVAASTDGGQTYTDESKSTYLDKDTLTTPNGNKWTIISVIYDTEDQSYSIVFKDKPFFWVVFEKDGEFLVLFVDGIGQEHLRLVFKRGNADNNSSSSS